ncbi:hypothetical protein [Nitrosomonas oligotropha]|uniref:Uncharacterized protein n=1 Tax=Nitrosomonas oligotropha TaxID=42354 RepID=A0A1H8R864_9PROT|nr:hypothetical protein [Nitrosomonas oligotropha]SDW83896.1 hypothetical protein SAMN05216300_11176 [Nitrosomonas oligotropha]SEO62334.1 hypothetical protein SAMN05216333_11377 [Nitrosomonas oligotropha]
MVSDSKITSCLCCGIENSGASVFCHECKELSSSPYWDEHFDLSLFSKSNWFSRIEKDVEVYQQLIGTNSRTIQRRLEAYIYGWLAGLGKVAGNESSVIRSPSDGDDYYENIEQFAATVDRMASKSIKVVIDDWIIDPIMMRYGSEKGAPIVNRSLIWLGRWLELQGRKEDALELHFCFPNYLDSDDLFGGLRRFCIARIMIDMYENETESFWALAGRHWPNWGNNFRVSFDEKRIYRPLHIFLVGGIESFPVLYETVKCDDVFRGATGMEIIKSVLQHRLSNARSDIEMNLALIDTIISNVSDWKERYDEQFSSTLFRLLLRMDKGNRDFNNRTLKKYEEIMSSTIREKLRSLLESDDYIKLRLGLPISEQGVRWYSEKYNES